VRELWLKKAMVDLSKMKKHTTRHRECTFWYHIRNIMEQKRKSSLRKNINSIYYLE